MAKRRKQKRLGKSETEAARSIANLLRSIITEVEAFVNQIIMDTCSEEMVKNLFLKMNLDKSGLLVMIQLLNVNTNTIVEYDIKLLDLVLHCQMQTLESLMNTQVPKMITMSSDEKKTDNIKTVYLKESLIIT
jgi:hypothetical protein